MSVIEPDSPILNITQHTATPEQLSAGVVEPSLQLKQTIKKLLTFQQPPTMDTLTDRAYQLAHIIVDKQFKYALVAGAPYFMPILVQILKSFNITPPFSFTKREAEEEHLPDGTVRTTYKFKHICFITI